MKTKYSIIQYDSETFHIIRTVYIFGISFSYEIVRDERFYDLLSAEERLTTIITHNN